MFLDRMMTRKFFSFCIPSVSTDRKVKKKSRFKGKVRKKNDIQENDYGKSQDFVVGDSSIFQSQFRQVNSKFFPTIMDL